ncbi:hypothetical protein K1W54_04675 [Micromonospora sp. CPCC 205371]|nr:hypothetical protein [Micromonospora sp. CPCC 205371]
MAAPDLYDPNPVGIDPAVLSRFDTLCSRMGLIAEAVNAFQDPALRERAFHELVTIISPVEDDDEVPDYHAEGVYCGEPAHCTPPHPGALPGTPYPAEVTRDSPEPANGTVLEDASGGDVWARRDGWLNVGTFGKTRPEQRWYSLNYGRGPYAWEDMWARREAEDIHVGPMRVLGPFVRNDPPPVPTWWTREAVDGGLRREPGRVDDRERP